MGWYKHHAIVVTTHTRRANAVMVKAASLGLPVSKAVPSTVNAFSSMLIAPDGSKEGWAASDSFDAKRGEMVEWLREQDVDFVEVSFGGDDKTATVECYSGDEVESERGDGVQELPLPGLGAPSPGPF